jgi:hypothetical protein
VRETAVNVRGPEIFTCTVLTERKGDTNCDRMYKQKETNVGKGREGNTCNQGIKETRKGMRKLFYRQGEGRRKGERNDDRMSK